MMISTSIQLRKNKGYSWKSKGNVFFKGVLLDEDINKFMDRVGKCTDEDQIMSYASGLKGSFSLIVELKDRLFAMVDHLRSIPLFYEFDQGTVYLYDWLDGTNSIHKELDSTMELLYSKSHFVYGNRTLFSDVYQIPAGHYIVFGRDNACKVSRYWEFKYDLQIKDMEKAIEQLRVVYDAVFKSVVNAIGDRTAIIPLSGGHDSRLVAYYLRKHGCKSIISFSYGDNGNPESTIANSVANVLNIPFHFIHYDKERIKKYDEIEQNYLKYAGDATSTISIQDIMAVDYLEEHNLIPKNSVFVPGLGGVLTGHYIRQLYLEKPEIETKELVSFIRNQHYGNFSSEEVSVCDLATKQICDYLNIDAEGKITGERANEFFEIFTYQEEQSKFIANAVRAYEFYGYSWITPLFDQRIFDIWRRISPKLRFGDITFREMERIEMPMELLSIGFTGSKEMRHFYNDNRINWIDKYKQRFLRYVLPRKTHYLNKFIPLRLYYYLLLFKRRCSIADAIAAKYISLIE